MGYFQVRYHSRVVIYDRRAFIRLVTGLLKMGNELGYLKVEKLNVKFHCSK